MYIPCLHSHNGKTCRQDHFLEYKLYLLTDFHFVLKGKKELHANTQLRIIYGVQELGNLFCGVLKWSGVKFCVVW